VFENTIRLSADIPFSSAGTKKKFKKDLKSTWYFHDNFGMTMSIEDLEDMMFSGTMFIQSIFNTEHYFKTEVVIPCNHELGRRCR